MAKIVSQKTLNSPSLHKHSKIPTIYRVIIYENDLRTSKERLTTPKDTEKEPQQDG